MSDRQVIHDVALPTSKAPVDGNVLRTAISAKKQLKCGECDHWDKGAMYSDGTCTVLDKQTRRHYRCLVDEYFKVMDSKTLRNKIKE